MPAQLSPLLGRPVALQDISINPFTLAVSVKGFGIAENDNTPFVGFEQFDLQYQFWDSIFNWGFSVTHIKLTHGYAKVRRLNNREALRFNFSDILDTLAANAAANATDDSQEQTDTDDPLAKIPHFIISDLAVVEFNLNLTDEITGSEVTYPRINLNVDAFDSHNPILLAASKTQLSDKKTNYYDVEFHGKHGGTVALKGQVQLIPLDIRGTIKLDKIDLPQFWGFVADDFNVSLDDGKVSFATDYRLALEGKQLIATTNHGELAVNQLAVHHQDKPVMMLDEIALHNIQFNLGEKQVTVDELSSDKLALNLRVDKQGVDLVTLFTPKSLQTHTQEPAQQAEPAQQTEPTQAPESVPALTDETQTLVSSSEESIETDENLTLEKAPEIAPEIASEKAPEKAVSQLQTAQAQGGQSQESQEQAPQGSLWSAILKSIKINGYQFTVTEQLVESENIWNINNLSLNTGSIDAALSAPVDYELSFDINDKGNIHTQGQLDLKAKQLEAKLALTELGLSQFQSYLDPFINIKLEQGRVSTQGDLFADAEGQASYQGAVQVDDLSVKDMLHNETLLQWQKMDINQLDFDKAANKLAIDTVTLTKAFSRILIAEDRTTNFQGLTKAASDNPEASELKSESQSGPQPASKSEPQSQPSQNGTQTEHSAPPMALSINRVIIDDGAAFFADNSLTPNFAAGIEQLSGSISDLSSSSDKPAKVDIKGKIDRYAPVVLKGEINPLLAQPYLDLDLSFKHVELTSVNPYSGTYAGYYIDKGLLSLDLTYRLENNKLVGNNHLVVDQLQLGKPSDSSLATTLPVTLAIALLQDRHGVIDLGLEVSGDLDEPSFSFGSIILTAFTNVITKAVTAPFSLLAGLLGSDDELDKVTFAQGSATLSSDAQALLDKLATGLKDRPKLSLSARGAVDPIEDSQALMTQMLKQKLAKIAQMDVSALPEDLSPSRYPTSGPLSDALKQLYQSELGSSPDEVKEQIKIRQELQAQQESQNQEEPKAQTLSEAELQTRWHIAMYNSLLSNQLIDDLALGALAQERAVAVKRYLIEHAQIAPERVFVLDSQAHIGTSASQALLTLTAD
ncbi:DUF748 domain-containing protein [Shewanella sp. AS1]|nr:DUF748 domain-containing protein [Shewanella sp. AS1]MCE9679499.1 DUF748 domain-containing protein [Shewanella sp. AS1]